ncbi:hypothetical protein PFICI_13368 [Pestalotiopsis fici W106-1]|uniref:Uncharacterized protein n=1 Tax=Pestalotiopsis fici (strain W106-1 / CGMCC3.15140) TaxID=1229662 RepID=W3WM96_PESFW|nr:uncharacterized protein PFICI_13368 [Pestalotiopsis fici W106-1]ETS74884.1 hypothetical protein PFICI_13368 [Pestalotiopsis fici W106-1]
MLSSTETVLPPATQSGGGGRGLYFDPPAFDSSSLTINSTGRKSLRRHKNLPHPRNHISKTFSAHNAAQAPQAFSESKLSWSDSSSQLSSPPSQSRRSGVPDLPPTPPALPRTSTSSQSTTTHSVPPSSPTCVATPVQSASTLSAARILPGTPPNQRSPPTPDVTPPHQARRPKAFRPLLLADRAFSKATTADSRTASFKTAREDPYSSDEDRKSMSRPTAASRQSSQNTVRQPSGSQKSQARSIGLGLGLESDENLTPRTKQEFFTFDGAWDTGSASNNEVELEWDDNLMRNVTVRKRRRQTIMSGEHASRDKGAEVLEDTTITPTNATKALRSMPLHEGLRVCSSPVGTSDRGHRWNSAATVESPNLSDVRRFSGVSTRSTMSTVVEAILVETPHQRPRTLRHVKKHLALRESRFGSSPTSSTTNSAGISEAGLRRRPRAGVESGRTDSYASSATVNSLASRKARRDVWKTGAIPVVVIPNRKTSMKSAGTPSLRSTSSRRSQRSNSLSPVPTSKQPREKQTPPRVDRGPQRGRARSTSASDASLSGDQRTADYPPIVPLRTSSLSAPTSRNNSRNNSRANSLTGSHPGSLTAESLKLHNALQAAQDQQTKDQPPPPVAVEHAPDVPEVEYIPAENDHPDPNRLQPTTSAELHKDKDTHDHKLLVDHNGDPFFGKRLTTHNTPFSIASIETAGTHHSAAEVSEALAVNIYPHKNQSLLVVNHLSKAFEANEPQEEKHNGTDAIEKKPVTAPEGPSITTTGPNGEPVTPPQPDFSLNDVDSPLRNPRAPPEPPAIKLTPATPSGLTPAADKMKMMGNYFESTNVERKPSLVRRAFSLRKNSDTGILRQKILSRTLSLTRNVRKETAENPAMEHGADAIRHQYPTIEDPPAEEEKLHPFWRPASLQLHFDPEQEDWVHDIPGQDDEGYRYPAPDSPRPPPPRRSLSARMKHTFAILPITSDDHYTSSDDRGPERRTIQRTTSGNLRVTRQRDTTTTGQDQSPSQRRRRHTDAGQDQERPSTAPTARHGHRAWGEEKRVDANGHRFFPGWQDKIGQIGIQGLQRRFSEKRRLKRSEELRQKISGPREVRDDLGEVIKRHSYKGPSYQTGYVRSSNRVEDDGTARAPRVQVQV